MKRIPYVILTAWVLFLGSCNEKENPGNTITLPIQAYQEHQPTAHHITALEVLYASKKWIAAFNAGNALDCGNTYAQDAVMQAAPFGKKQGKQEIISFWAGLIESGASDLSYSNVGIEVVDEKTAFLSAHWQMNIGTGIIYQEKWEKEDGQWKLTYDDFEVLEQFEKPMPNVSSPTGSHQVLEEVIKESMEWITAFNAQDGERCGQAYWEEATMNANPITSAHEFAEIKNFWKQLISDGAKNLIYHNLSLSQVAPDRVLLSAHWSMNIGEGKIYQEKWVKSEGKWGYAYDEFQVLKSYSQHID